MATNCVDCGKKFNRYFDDCERFADGFVCRDCANKRFAEKKRIEEEKRDNLTMDLNNRYPTRKRPTSVTIISWLIIIGNTIKIILIISNPPSSAERLLLSIIFGIIFLISGIAMLNGHNWGRWLYICSFLIGAVFGWLLYGFHLISSMIRFAVFLFIYGFLTNVDADKFFLPDTILNKQIEELRKKISDPIELSEKLSEEAK